MSRQVLAATCGAVQHEARRSPFAAHTITHAPTELVHLACASPLQIVADALRYFGLHFQDPITITELALALGSSEDCLTFSFDRIRGMTPAEALQEHRLNKLFSTLTDQPRQGLGRAIQACGLGQTRGVLPLFEQTFGIGMPLFLLTCRRAADDRLFRREHPEAEALVLPS